VFVPETTRQELEEIYDVREMLECAVVARFCGRLPEQTLREMRDIYDEMGGIVQSARQAKKMGQRGERFCVLDSAFHLAMIRGTGNRQLFDVIAQLRKKCCIKRGGASAMAELVGHVFRAEPFDSVERTQQEHHELLLLLEHGDQEKASELACRHIRAGRELALAASGRACMHADASQRASRPRAR
jgi:DNA-binding GntR family transcriptional regulator